MEWRATEDILQSAGRKTCLHAGGVRLGAANVLLIGASGAGKSTLTAWLMAAGNTAWGDDLVCFAPSDGSFSAFPRSLKLDDKTLSDLDLVHNPNGGLGDGIVLAPPVAYVSPAAFRADWEAPPGLADAVVLLDSERHTGQVTVESVSEGAAAIMASQSLIAGGDAGMEHTRLMLRVLEALADARAWRVSGAGARDVARALETAVRHAR